MDIRTVCQRLKINPKATVAKAQELLRLSRLRCPRRWQCGDAARVVGCIHLACEAYVQMCTIHFFTYIYTIIYIFTGMILRLHTILAFSPVPLSLLFLASSRVVSRTSNTAYHHPSYLLTFRGSLLSVCLSACVSVLHISTKCPFDRSAALPWSMVALPIYLKSLHSLRNLLGLEYVLSLSSTLPPHPPPPTLLTSHVHCLTQKIMFCTPHSYCIGKRFQSSSWV
jgi:hypothetical protein